MDMFVFLSLYRTSATLLEREVPSLLQLLSLSGFLTLGGSKNFTIMEAYVLLETFKGLELVLYHYPDLYLSTMVLQQR